MLSRTTATKPHTDHAKPANPALRKIWLPKLLYDCLPIFYLTSGIAALFTTLYISNWLWIVPHYFLFSAACIHFGILLFRRRNKKDQ